MVIHKKRSLLVKTLKSKLSKHCNGLIASSKWEILYDAKKFAEIYDLPLPDWFEAEYRGVCKKFLFCYREDMK